MGKKASAADNRAQNARSRSRGDGREAGTVSKITTRSKAASTRPAAKATPAPPPKPTPQTNQTKAAAANAKKQATLAAATTYAQGRPKTTEVESVPSSEVALREQLARVEAALEATKDKAAHFESKAAAEEEKAAKSLERALCAESRCDKLQQRAAACSEAEASAIAARERAARAEAKVEVLLDMQDKMPEQVRSIVQSIMMLSNRRGSGRTGGHFTPVKLELEDPSGPRRSQGCLPIADFEAQTCGVSMSKVSVSGSANQVSGSSDLDTEALLDFYSHGSVGDSVMDDASREDLKSQPARGAISSLKGVLQRAAAVGTRSFQS
jgi:hypothetical protein